MSKSSTTIERVGPLRPVHPGRLLAGEMEARGLSALALSLRLRVPANRISEIVKGRRGITAETALRLGLFFKTGPELWLRLQSSYDLAVAEKKTARKFAKRSTPRNQASPMSTAKAYPHCGETFESSSRRKAFSKRSPWPRPSVCWR